MKSWLSFVLGGLLLIALFFSVDRDAIYVSLLQVSPIFLIGSLVANLLFFVLRAVRWKIILIPAKNSVKLSNAFWLTGVGYFANTMVPTRIGGELVRAYLMDRKEKTGFVEVLSSVGLERLFDLLAIVALAFVGYSLFPQSLDPSISTIFIFVLAIVLVGFGIVMAAVLWEQKVLFLLERVLRTVPVVRNRITGINKFIKSLVAGVKIVNSRPDLFVISLVLSASIWLTSLLGLYLLFLAFGMSLLPQVILFGGMVFMLTAILPAPPGYVGSYELFWTLVFLPFGIPQQSLLAVGFVSHSIFLFVNTLLGVIGISRLGSNLREVLSIRRPKADTSTS